MICFSAPRVSRYVIVVNFGRSIRELRGDLAGKEIINDRRWGEALGVLQSHTLILFEQLDRIYFGKCDSSREVDTDALRQGFDWATQRPRVAGWGG